MPARIEFCLLGPLAVRRDGVATPVARGNQRAVLAALLLDHGRVLSFDELAEVLWGPGPPPSARVTIQNYVMRLRKALGDADGGRISTQPGGYLIRVDADEFDVTRFEAHLGAARAAARDGVWDIAAAQARAALSLWRGDPLAEVDSDLLATREIPRLAELRLQALDTRIDADLQLGRNGAVIAELRQLVERHPLREHPHAQLMLALYRDGRPAEALAAYARARQILAEELGSEPGAALRELHQRILTADPALTWPPVHWRLVPRELPADVRHFTGRTGELGRLTGLLGPPGPAAGPLTDTVPGLVVIAAVGGTAGVGKTALALHWAHQVADRFPDGQLYVNLRGYDPDRPLPAADALAGFLRALGVPGPDVPAKEDERARRYRSMLAGRRILIILDNASSAEQVRPLLPGSSACAVLVTSRDALSGLVVGDGATRLDLDPLTPADAVALLRALVGDRVDADPEAAADLAAHCSRLPLALRLAAELAAARPAVLLADLAGELADQQQRLELLDAGGDRRTALRAVFSWSYRQLDAPAARAFRLAGLHPGGDLDPFAMAALTGTAVGPARLLLDALARASLVHHARPGRYGLHDLLRGYARRLAAEADAEADRRVALTRLFDYYMHTAAAAMDTLFPAEHHRRPRITQPDAVPGPPVGSTGTARAWLDTERDTLIRVVAHAAAEGWTGHATGIAGTIFRYLDTEGCYQDAVTVCARALDAARLAGDRAAEATALLTLGGGTWRLGRYQEAAGYLGQALTAFRATGDRAGQARALGNLGVVESGQGRHEQAAGYHRQALALIREAGDRLGEAQALDSLGAVLGQQGHHRRAAQRQRRALLIYRELGERHSEGSVLCGLGVVEWRQGRYQEAAGHLRQAVDILREIGDRPGQARALGNLGVVEWWQGHHEQAARHHRDAAGILRQIGDQPGEAEALNASGEAWCAAGQPGLAKSAHGAARDLAVRIGDRYQQARAHDGLGYACRAADDPGQARRHWERALAIYTSLGAPDADATRARLDDLAGDTAAPGCAGYAPDGEPLLAGGVDGEPLPGGLDAGGLVAGELGPGGLGVGVLVSEGLGMGVGAAGVGVRAGCTGVGAAFGGAILGGLPLADGAPEAGAVGMGGGAVGDSSGPG